MAHCFGFTNAVAVLGTALGQDHIKLLSRLGAEKMILMLDGDKAGQSKAQSNQVLTDFISQGADMSVLILPENLDPCEYLEKYGTDELKNLLETKSVNALDHIIRVKTQGIDTKTDIIASSKALNEIIAITAHTPPQKSPNDPVAFRIEKVLQTLSVRFDIPLDEIKKRFSELQKSVRAKNPTRADAYDEDSVQADSAVPFIKTLPDSLEREMLELWLAEPATMHQFWETVPLEWCRSPITQTIYMKCSELVEHGKPATIQHLLTAFDAPEMKNFLVKLADSSDEKFRTRTKESLQVAVTEIEDAFERREEQHSQMKHINQIKDSRLSDDEKLNQLLQIQQTLRQKQRAKNE
jgi:DNA primase